MHQTENFDSTDEQVYYLPHHCVINEAQLLEVVQNQKKQKEYRVHPVEFCTIKTLVILWNPAKDSFLFPVKRLINNSGFQS